MSSSAKVRLYLDQKLLPGATVALPEETSHYVCNVMRLPAGSRIICFNAEDGEFAAQITAVNKKRTEIVVAKQLRQPQKSPDIWLLCAPLKKDRMDFVVEKAVELGVSKLVPVITRYTITDKIREERIRAQMTEAAEQCERLDIPELGAPCKLETLLRDWNPERTLYFMDERGNGETCAQAFAAGKAQAALLIGPEGGFAEAEAALLRACPFVCPVSLGPRILRAETAAAAALAVWQAIAGDWKENKK